MEDREIIALYWQRLEQAITETAAKYGTYCRTIAMGILRSSEDAEECLSDTWLGAWNSIPPQQPTCLRVFLGRITRNAALDRYAYRTAQKRNDNLEEALEELGECVSGGTLEADFDLQLLGDAISAYLHSVKPLQRQVFLRRYWYGDTLEEIGRRFALSPGAAKSMLHRTRSGLREYLIQEGFTL